MHLVVLTMLFVSPSPTVAVANDDAVAIELAVRALFREPAFAKNEQAKPGFCLGVYDTKTTSPRDPSPELLKRLSSEVIPTFPLSQCEKRQGWGNRKHIPTGLSIGQLELGFIVQASPDTKTISVLVNGGAFAAAGFNCVVTKLKEAKCSLSGIS